MLVMCARGCVLLVEEEEAIFHDQVFDNLGEAHSEVVEGSKLVIRGNSDSLPFFFHFLLAELGWQVLALEHVSTVLGKFLQVVARVLSRVVVLATCIDVFVNHLQNGTESLSTMYEVDGERGRFIRLVVVVDLIVAGRELFKSSLKNLSGGRIRGMLLLL